MPCHIHLGRKHDLSGTRSKQMILNGYVQQKKSIQLWCTIIVLYGGGAMGRTGNRAHLDSGYHSNHLLPPCSVTVAYFVSCLIFTFFFPFQTWK